MTRWRRDRSGRADTVSDRVWEQGGHGFAGHACDVSCRWWQRGVLKRRARSERRAVVLVEAADRLLRNGPLPPFVVYVPGLEVETVTLCPDFETARRVVKTLGQRALIMSTEGLPLPPAVQQQVEATRGR